MKKIFAFLLALMMVFTLAACGNSNKHEGQAKTPSGSDIQKGSNYKDVIDEFKKAGFTNIKTNVLDDLITGWLTKDGEVESVSVDGDKDYAPDDWYPKNVEVIITYHTFPTEETDTTTTEETEIATEGTEPITENLETTFPINNAKRAAVVALTNAYADDVFKKDGNTYNISKFHSYADVSGYFMKVTSWGTWSVKDKKTWHVDDLMLEINGYGTSVDATLDVRFNGTNYIISNVTGTLGSDTDISEIEAGNNHPYLMVPPALIKANRNQKEVEAQDHSGDLDESTAQIAFEHYGKAEYPYGFKCHWIIDLRAEDQASDGSWFFKVGVTITNQYGTHMDTVAEGTISGTTANPVVKEFYVY